MSCSGRLVCVRFTPLSPRTYLMSGRMPWDELDILFILRSLLRIGENQQVANEAVAYQLPEIINALKDLVVYDSSRFCGQHTLGTS